MSGDKAKALVTDVGISCKLLVYAKFALGRGENESWWPSLVIHPGDLPGLNIKIAGWLLHAMFCITGTAGYLEQPLLRERMVDGSVSMVIESYQLMEHVIAIRPLLTVRIYHPPLYIQN